MMPDKSKTEMGDRCQGRHCLVAYLNRFSGL
jgi:hypothetical protein